VLLAIKLAEHQQSQVADFGLVALEAEVALEAHGSDPEPVSFSF